MGGTFTKEVLEALCENHKVPQPNSLIVRFPSIQLKSYTIITTPEIHILDLVINHNKSAHGQNLENYA